MVFPAGEAGSGNGGFCLFVGRLTVEKGIRELLQAWQHAPQLSELVIAGSGPLEAEVTLAAETDNRIRFLGQQSKDAIRALMGSASLLVFPSRWFENCPMTILESLSVGTPIATSDLETVRDLLSTGPHVEYFDCDHVDSMATAIERVLQSSTFPERRQSALRRFGEKFSSDSNLEQLASIYDSALAQANRISV
jgi:glycosyltransferase involved in cell wall biosynthesis